MKKAKKKEAELFNAAERIFNILRDKHWSQHDLSRKSGIRQSTISSWSSGRNQPTIETIIKICVALDMTLSEFFMTESERSDIDVCIVQVTRSMTYREKEILMIFARFLISVRNSDDP